MSHAARPYGPVAEVPTDHDRLCLPVPVTDLEACHALPRLDYAVVERFPCTGTAL